MKPRVLITEEHTEGWARGICAWLYDLDRPYYVAEIRHIAKQLTRHGKVFVSYADAKMFKDIVFSSGYWNPKRPFLTFREEKV